MRLLTLFLLMALPATETFTGGAATMPDPPWTQTQPTNSNLARNGSGAGGTSSGSQDCSAYWNADSFNADQYSQFKITAAGFKFPCVRMSADVGTAAFDHYCYTTNTVAGTSYIAKWINGAETIIGALGVATAVNDVIRIEVEGTNLRAYKNGVQMGTTQSDAAFASGAAGCGTDTAGTIDDWEGGNLGPPPVYAVAWLTA